jgi:hypothetical protein
MDCVVAPIGDSIGFAEKPPDALFRLWEFLIPVFVGIGGHDGRYKHIPLCSVTF